MGVSFFSDKDNLEGIALHLGRGDWKAAREIQGLDYILSQMSPLMRNAVEWTIDGLSVAKIAKMLGKKPSTVSVTLHKAKRFIFSYLDSWH